MSEIASFGAWLRRRRKLLDLTQDDLARRVGCSLETIRKIEGDARRPSRQVADLLATHLELLPEEREDFIRCARAELSADRLPSPAQSAPRAALAPAPTPTSQISDPGTANLPAQATALIGREHEIADVHELLRRPSVRLLTLTGPGGIGKTRLALQAAAELLDDARNGVWFVPLAPIRDPTLVLAAIAQALGVTEAAGEALDERVKAYLRPRQILLLIDNFEQVAAAGPLIGELLAAAPGLKIMVTSREVLHVYGEHEYAVPPLGLPHMRRLPPLERLTQYEAVRLFIERAQAVRPDFVVTGDNAPAIAEICVRLDGLPLAIELAAARIKHFTPQALLARLQGAGALALLTHGPRDVPARQQTIRDTIAWSYDLLDPAEQAIFARLAVFVGGCTLEAAEVVLADDRQSDDEMSVFIPASAVLDGLASLVDKGLLKQLEGVGDVARFVMLETIHEFALEQFEASGEVAILRRRYAGFYVALAETAAPELLGTRAQVWLGRLDAEHANLRAVLAWGVDSQDRVDLGLRLATALRWFWITLSLWREGYSWLERAVALSRQAGADPAMRVKALCAAGHMAVLWGDPVQGIPLIEEGIALARQEGDRIGAAEALAHLGFNIGDRGDYARAEALVEESLALYQAEGDSYGTILASLFLGDVAHWQSHLPQATGHFEAALTLSQEAGYTILQCLALLNLGRIAYAQAEYIHAQALLSESRELFQQLGSPSGVAAVQLDLGRVARAQGDAVEAARQFAESLAWYHEFCGSKSRDTAYGLEGLAGVAAAHGQAMRAARLFGAAEALRKSAGIQLPPIYRADYERDITLMRANLDEASFAAAWAEGRALPLDQAVADALAIAALGSDG